MIVNHQTVSQDTENQCTLKADRGEGGAENQNRPLASPGSKYIISRFAYPINPPDQADW